MATIGKIKIGAKNDRGLPVSLDHFICDSNYKKFFTDAYGDKPSTIQVAFISDDFRDSCNERFECRDKQGRLAGYGDGAEMYLYNPATKKYEIEPDRQKLANAGKWDVLLTLRFIIPKIRGVLGLFQLTTKGKESSIPKIRDSFDFVLSVAGSVINVPFDLSVQKVKSQKPGENSLFPVIQLVPNISRDNMETLRGYLQQGHDIKELGMITEEKIKQLNA